MTSLEPLRDLVAIRFLEVSSTTALVTLDGVQGAFITETPVQTIFLHENEALSELSALAEVVELRQRLELTVMPAVETASFPALTSVETLVTDAHLACLFSAPLLQSVGSCRVIDDAPACAAELCGG